MDGFDVDPTHATSLDVKRRAFVGIAAGATAGLGAVAQALAQSTPLSQAHPPLEPENDPAIVAGHPKLSVAGAELPSYAAWPKDARAGTSSVLVVMHVWGVDTSIRDVVRRFAAAGFAAIAPDLYGRFNAPSGDGQTDSATFRSYAGRLERTQFVPDLRAGADWLAQKFPSTRTAIMEFCMGGRIALQTAVDTGTRFSAVGPFYGAVEGTDPQSVAIPVCGSYGARDTSIPEAGVRAFFDALQVPHDLRIYDEAGHAFFDDQRKSYVASAAQDAWARTLAFLRKYGEPANT